MYIKNNKKTKKYTIISTFFNVSSCISFFLETITNQTLNFENNIDIICVDDGSTDGTDSIIKHYINKYPNNIKYVYQQNNGKAIARNNGLKYTTTDWITFIDPDDFIDKNYFLNIEKLIQKYKEKLTMIGARIIIYDENDEKFKTNHSLDFKFQNEKLIKVKDLGLNIQLSVASAFFRLTDLKKNKIFFHTDIKSNFGDVFFINQYLSHCLDKYVIFTKNSKYFHRKRINTSSTLSNSWKNKLNLIDVIEKGYLKLLSLNSFLFTKYTILHELMRHIIYLVDNNEALNFMSIEEQNKYFNLVKKCFSCFSNQEIISFNLFGGLSYHKIGIFNCLKDCEIEYKIKIYVEDYDIFKDEIKIRYFTNYCKLEEFTIDNKEIIPMHSKLINHEFVNHLFCIEKIHWLPLYSMQGNLSIKLDKKYVNIYFNQTKLYKCNLENIRSFFKKKYKKYDKKAPWIFIDRETQADDNAEHLYRWMRKNHPEHNIVFALRKDSIDWERLRNEGFNLVEFGGNEYIKTLNMASKIISSHIDNYIVDFFKDGSTIDKQILWLQHGVTKDDLSKWINSKKRIDLFVTETNEEYNSIISDKSKYRFTDKEVKLVGFPRHDALIAKNYQNKQILIMPTWRSNIVGKQIFGNIREKNIKFKETLYAKAWSSLLNSKIFEHIIKTYNYNVVFSPHPNISLYINEFHIPEYIQVIHERKGSIQNLFQNSSIMITDYSSVAFEMAFLKKIVIYYQFDRNEIFCGCHTYRKGYFDYEKNGFGPVAETLDVLLEQLKICLSSNKEYLQKYYQRMDKAFKFYDSKNCERTYNAICNIEKSYPTTYFNKDIAIIYIYMAIERRCWKTALRRLKQYKVFEDKNDIIEHVLEFREKLQNGYFNQSQIIYRNIEKHIFNTSDKIKDIIYEGMAFLKYFQDKKEECKNFIEKINNINIRIFANALLLNSIDTIDNEIKKSDYREIIENYIYKNFAGVVNFVISNDKRIVQDFNINLYIYLMACKACIDIKNFKFKSYFMGKIENMYNECKVWRFLIVKINKNSWRFMEE